MRAGIIRSPEQQLWAQVLFTAFADAVRFGDGLERDGPVTVRNSMAWLASRDAAMICALAGVGPMNLQRSAEHLRREYLASGKTWRKFWSWGESA